MKMTGKKQSSKTIVTCVSTFVDPAEVGESWEFETRKEAEDSLGRYFIDNHCVVKSTCGYFGCSFCDPDNAWFGE